MIKVSAYMLKYLSKIFWRWDVNNNLKIELEFLQKINYSLINSGKRIIESVVIDNQSEEEFRDLVCSISFVPSFIKPLNFGITYIGKNQKIKEDKIITPINFEYFYSLNESYKASIVVSLKKGEEVICEKYQSERTVHHQH